MMKTTTRIMAMILIIASVGVVTSAFIHSGLAFAKRDQLPQHGNNIYIPEIRNLVDDIIHIPEFQLWDDLINVIGDLSR